MAAEKDIPHLGCAHAASQLSTLHKAAPRAEMGRFPAFFDGPEKASKGCQGLAKAKAMVSLSLAHSNRPGVTNPVLQ